MSGRWFRVYDDLIDDPKVQRLPAELFRALVNLWCLASKGNGGLPPLKDVAYKLRISESRAAQIITRLGEAGLLDAGENGPTPHNWSGRQYKSDVSTERVKRFRKRHETVSVTPPDTDTDTEQRGGAKAPPKRASQVPAGWTPSLETLDLLKTKKGFPPAIINSELEKFRDFHQAKGSVFKDFEAAFRTWMAKAREWATPGNGKGPPVVRGPWKPFTDSEPVKISNEEWKRNRANQG